MAPEVWRYSGQAYFILATVDRFAILGFFPDPSDSRLLRLRRNNVVTDLEQNPVRHLHRPIQPVAGRRHWLLYSAVEGGR